MAQAPAGAAAGGSRGGRRRTVLVAVGLLVLAVAGFGAFRLVGDRGPTAGSGDAGSTTTSALGTPAGADSTAPAPPTPSTTSPGGPATSSPPPTGAPPSARPGRLVLGGEDLGVTRLGAPAREAVAAVAASLGRPRADPATDSACIGAERETTWDGFRLGVSGGRISGWRSTSPSLTTPAGVAAGTTVAALRTAYGTALAIRPTAEPGEPPIFLVDGTALGGTLTGSEPAATVTSLFAGTCAS